MSSSSVRILAVVFLVICFIPVLSIAFSVIGSIVGGIFTVITSIIGAVFSVFAGIGSVFEGIFGSQLVLLILLIAGVVYLFRKF